MQTNPLATTTVMRDSAVGDAWIREMCQANPVQRVIGDDGQPNGNILTGPVRLTFCDALFEAKPGMRSAPESPTNPKKFNTGMLFTPFTVFDLFWEEYYKVAAASFASHFNNGQYYGLDNPIYDQGGKMKYQGYTPGCFGMNSSSNFKPPVVDIRNNPVSPDKVYPGVWAIIALNAYASGLKAARKGPRFGLQTIMIVGDDLPISGGGPVDPKAAFKGVNVKPPTAIPAAAFGQHQHAPPTGPGTNAYYPPPPPSGAPPRPAVPPPLGAGDDDLSQFR